MMELTRNPFAVVRRLERGGVAIGFLVNAPDRDRGLVITRVTPDEPQAFALLDALTSRARQGEPTEAEQAVLARLGLVLPRHAVPADVFLEPDPACDDCEPVDPPPSAPLPWIDRGYPVAWVRHRRTGVVWPARESARLAPVGGPESGEASTTPVLDASGVVELPGVFPRHACAALARYYEGLRREGHLACGDPQSHRWVRHDEPLQRWIQRAMLPYLERVVGAAIRPSYTYLGIYEPGADLPRHTDREQCGYTLSVSVDGAGAARREDAWPLFVEMATGARAIHLLAGDGVLFRGVELPHWRHALTGTARSISLFFHFVPIDYQGPTA